MAVSGSNNGDTYTMFNLNRLDGPDVDQMPLMIVYREDGPGSGVLIQHGDYPGRTTPIPAQTKARIRTTGILSLSELPAAMEGTLDQLNVGSQERAFNLLVNVQDKAVPPTQPPAKPEEPN
jgi:hypothetical protein